MLRQGKIVFDGTPADIQKTQDPVVRRFVTGAASEEELAGLR
jgi:ABC-type transporter Mla maintaining outer membrane lipid asymmetry ATPase subunit MlaF